MAFPFNYLGGRSIGAITKKIKQYNAKGIAVSASLLPLTLHSQALIDRDVEEYKQLLAALHEQKLNADITIKLSQLGFSFDTDVCTAAARSIVHEADCSGIFVWIDAEMPEEVDYRLWLYETLRNDYPALGVCVQAYLKRSRTDCMRLVDQNATVRLVKGIYNVCEFKHWREVGEHYRAILSDALGNTERFAIATHDPANIAYARELIEKRDCRDQVEFQHMAGVNDAHLASLAREGFATRVYMPYGDFLAYLADDWKRLDKLRGLQRVFGRGVIT